MILGRVAGRIYSTIHHPAMEKHRLLIIDHLDARGEATGKYLIALDSVGAGAGEQVLVLDEGNGSRQILGDSTAPVRSLVVGIVDELDAG
ncbi:MAG: EutN/CcmL family microcompartment protein [Candidatus Krumholzibacteria bacterium]|jgi:ethanolamine utilization protein EutN|nr:EutN/CcmL family microcompartment protein [Candidatus Krumholzibacteria bacterium]MDP6668515.1 EutN/CcmL family microcompartment protein [Candidatus Krumholzibacteria bacterium]MDP6797811.1 EutN/CcmL family microcompartment protein [Candidatus Krumholzibacteria bacterium]MDP7021396.1 EutN/CcmL family microcompartment protein [Candidatus Krumholzibacteria bacterium]